MAALTPARNRRSGLLPAQVSTVHHDNFPAYPAQPPATLPTLTFDERAWSCRSWLAPQASPLSSRLAVVSGRIGFTCVWVCGSASSCSPPRLTATQLPSAALPLLVSGGLRLSLVGIMVTSFALGRGVPDAPGTLPRHPHPRDHRVKTTRLANDAPNISVTNKAAKSFGSPSA